MIANKTIGEVVVCADFGGQNLEIKLRPSFYSFNKIGDVNMIDFTIKNCIKNLADFSGGLIFLSCLDIVKSCSADSDEELNNIFFGFYTEKNGILEYEKGILDQEDIIILANHLIKYGVIGTPISGRKKSSVERHLFNPCEYVGSAVSLLGIGLEEAWNMTMVEFQRCIDSKFPLDPKKEPIPQNVLAELERKSKIAHSKLNEKRSL